ncbi:hypothetical protein [Rhodococcus qingshengii]|uniref:Uncharacterized protein n=1 Tax=Rhodococcus qingshengii TaxID=334542 RepID=A0A2A5IXE6_RHOSG|nr:hypothetical protein [Rhodococcus qingshengii]PCK22005.1 hypothetical protein CHR55_33250 [Rhodococcus qingshengii]
MFSTAVLSKFKRADTHISALLAEIAEWNSSARIDTDLSSDGLTFRMNLIITEAPDLDHWACILGDAIHNMRAALDIWMWERLTAEIEKEPKSTNVYFPIRVDENGFSRWEAEAKKQGMKDETIAALRSIQPFLADPAAGRNVLRHVHLLDIADKHKRIVDLRVQPQGAGPMKVSGLMQPDPASDFDVVLHNVDVRTGGTIVEITSSTRLLTATAKPRIQLIPYYVFGGDVCELWENLGRYSSHLQTQLSIVERRAIEMKEFATGDVSSLQFSEA